MSDLALRGRSPISVPAVEFSDALAELRRFVLDEVTLHVVDHHAGFGHAATIASALRELYAFWGRQSCGIFLQRHDTSNFVQAWLHTGRTGIYCEAIDKDAYRRGSLSTQQRQQLLALGWHDPKRRPYSPSEYEWLWDQNYSLELPTRFPQIASHLALTLSSVYRLRTKDDLTVRLNRREPDHNHTSASAGSAGRAIAGRTESAKSVRLA